MNNPFNPTFGDVPQIFLDTDSRINDLIKTIKNSSFARSFFITGVRGSGKTVFLNAVGQTLDKDKSCIRINLLNNDNLVESFTKKLLHATTSNLKKVVKSVSSISVKGLNIDLSSDSLEYDEALKEMLIHLKKQNKYVVVTIDEISNSEAVRKFAQVSNELKGEKLPLFVLMTGLPDLVLNLQTEKNLTFLLRSEKIHTLPLKPADVIASYQKIFKCSLELANKMAQMVGGYAYGFQLLGFLLFNEVNVKVPTFADLENITLQYKLQLFDNAYQKIFDDLSENDRKYLLFVKDGGKLEEIVQKWGKSRVYVAQYRRRAIERDLVKPVGHGIVNFTLPYFADYLNQVQDPNSVYYLGY